jgi:hypothetical protein
MSWIRNTGYQRVPENEPDPCRMRYLLAHSDHLLLQQGALLLLL